MHDCRGDASGMSESGYSGYNALTSESRYGSHSRASRHSREVEVREAREAREARGEGDSDARWFAHVVRDDHEAQSLIKVRLSLSLSLSLSLCKDACRQAGGGCVGLALCLAVSISDGNCYSGEGRAGWRRWSRWRKTRLKPTRFRSLPTNSALKQALVAVVAVRTKRRVREEAQKVVGQRWRRK